MILFLFLFLSSFLSVPFHHLFELPMLSQLLLFLFLLIKLPLFPFLFKPTPRPGVRVSLFILEDGLIVNVLQSWDSTDDTLSVMGNFLVKRVILHVDDGNLGHFH